MSTQAPWDEDGRTHTRDRQEVEDIDLESTAIIHRQQQHVQRSELDFASLCQLAQSMGPRDRATMLTGAKDVGAMLGAQLKPDGSCAAYYAWEQGGKLIEGPTVDLMEGLAEVWGRVAKSVELVDESPTSVELRGVVIDLLALSITRRPFVGAIMPAPAKYAKKPEQRQRWHASQLQSAASKAIRGALEHALPAWLVNVAVDAGKVAHAKAVLGGATMEQVVPRAVGHLHEKYGLDETTLVAWLEVPRSSWTLQEVARLRGLAEDLKAGRRTPEQIRAAASEAAPVAQADGDRLSGLGLGQPAPAPAPQPSPAPSTSSAPSATVSSGAGSTSTSSPPASGGSPAASEVDQVDPDQAERTQLIELLALLGADLSEGTRDSLRSQHDLRKISRTRADLGKLRGLVDATKRAVADKLAKEGIVVPEPWPGPPDLESLADRLRAELPLVGGGARALMDRAGAPSLDGAPEPALRRLLVLVEAHLDEHPPEPVEWTDTGVPLEPTLGLDLEEWVVSLGDGLICRAAHEAGLVVTVAGPEVPPESEGAARRRFLARLRALGEGR